MTKEELVQIDFSNPVNQILLIIILLIIMGILILVGSVIGIILVVKYYKSAKEIFGNKVIPYIDEEEQARRTK